MKRLWVLTACLIACLTSAAKADIVLDTNGLPATILEGTPTISFNLDINGIGTDVGAPINAFTYAVQSTTTGTGTALFEVPPSLTGIASGFNLTDQSAGLGGQILFGNAVAPAGVTSNLSGSVLSISMDTSSLVAGDIVSFNLDANSFASVSNGATVYTKGAFPSPSFSVTAATAIPEPSSLMLLGGASALLIARRRRR